MGAPHTDSNPLTTSAPTRGRAVFLDRDGTLIEDRGHLSHPDQIHLLPQTIPALLRLQEQFDLFIVTHQGGIARKLITEAEAHAVNHALVAMLAAHGIHIREVFTCPHDRSEGCDCIKPSPFHAIEAAARYGLCLADSYVVGDHGHDADMATAFGGHGIYVLTGHGRKHLPELGPGYTVCADISEATDLMLATTRQTTHHLRLSLAQAATILRQGGTVGMPTETVYGLAANALDPDAVVSIFEIKQRPSFDPLIVHIADHTMLPLLAAHIPPAAQTLADTFWPGPLTLVLPRQPRVPDVVTAGLETVGIRFPSHPVAQALIREAGMPLAAPSANLFGQVSPTCATHVLEQLGARIPGVVEGGPCKIGVESTIVGFWKGRQLLLRPGGISVEAIEATIGPLERYLPEDAGDVPAPGTMPRHYAPGTPLQWADLPIPAGASRLGYLQFGTPHSTDPAHTLNLSPAGNLHQAAATLYSAMRKLDAMELDLILVDRIPRHDIGLAIHDRLSRAMHA